MKAHLTTSLVLALAAPAALAQCPITGPGTPETAPPLDNWSPFINFGFLFPLGGMTYDGFFYSDHGLIALGNTGDPTPPGTVQVYDPGAQPNTNQINGGFAIGGGGFVGFGTPTIMAYWGDHTVGMGTVSIDNRATHCTITWENSEPYLNFVAGAFTAQLTLNPSGSFTVCLDDRCNNTSSTFEPVTTVIGVWDNNAGGTIPAMVDLSSGAAVSPTDTIFEEFTGPGPIGSNTPDPNFDLASTTLEFVPTNPGWVCIPSALVCAGTTSVGTGCAGLTLASNTAPTLGGAWDLELGGVTSPFPNFIAFGNALPPTPVGLLFPTLFPAACNAHMGAEFGLVDIGPAVGGMALFSLPIPNDATLKGASLVGQGVSLQLAGPPFGLSNGEAGTLGY